MSVRTWRIHRASDVAAEPPKERAARYREARRQQAAYDAKEDAKARRFLRKILHVAGSDGMPVDDIQQLAAECGVHRRNLLRARRQLQLFSNGARWAIPGASPSGQKRTLVGQAEAFLRSLLANGQPMMPGEIKRRAAEKGISWLMVKRAKMNLEIESLDTPIGWWRWSSTKRSGNLK